MLTVAGLKDFCTMWNRNYVIFCLVNSGNSLGLTSLAWDRKWDKSSRQDSTVLAALPSSRRCFRNSFITFDYSKIISRKFTSTWITPSLCSCVEKATLPFCWAWGCLYAISFVVIIETNGLRSVGDTKRAPRRSERLSCVFCRTIEQAITCT